MFAILSTLLCPFIPTTRLVLKNLKFAMPEKTFPQRIRIALGVWYNLGRFIGEYPYIYRMKDNEIFNYVKISEDTKQVIDRIKNSDTGNLIFSGHISNWEAGLRALRDSNTKLNVVFRIQNNVMVDSFTTKSKESLGIKMIAKQDNAAFKIVRALKNKENVIILADQRDTNNGILLNFFKRPAHTSKTIYVFTKILNIPVYGMRIVRKNSINFELKVEKVDCIGEIIKAEFLQGINDILEKWVREYPEQWFWVHNRWKM
jgi:KDO2-lipid IV(A) lauroyltransferase